MLGSRPVTYRGKVPASEDVMAAASLPGAGVIGFEENMGTCHLAGCSGDPQVTSQQDIERWLTWAWSRAHAVSILEGGEGAGLLAGRAVLARHLDGDVVERVRSLTTVGVFSGDRCRCDGDLTLALYDKEGALLGSASVHPHRISWERDRFQNDLILGSAMPSLQIFLAESGIAGSSRSLLEPMISALNLHEGEVQFRPAGDLSALHARRVPQALVDDLREMSGREAAEVNQVEVDRMAAHLVRTEPDVAVVVRQLLRWLGYATWPGEAISGDGQLARRILAQVDSVVIADVARSVNEPAEVMGALALAALSNDDVALVTAIGPKVQRLLAE